MNLFSLRAVVNGIDRLSNFHLIMTAMNDPGGITDDEINNAVTILGGAKNAISFVGLTASCVKIDDTIELIVTLGKGLNRQALGFQLRNIHSAITEEAERTFRFVAIPKDTSWSFGETPFGIEVELAFPSAGYDIKQAGACIAFESYSASVFHLMRTAEYGMRALCKKLRVKYAIDTNRSGSLKYTPIAYAEWQRQLTELEKKADEKLSRMAKGPKKQQAQEFYHEAIQELRAFKDVHRNHVMHTRKDYTKEDAVAVFGHVKRFMLKLSENGIGEV